MPALPTRLRRALLLVLCSAAPAFADPASDVRQLIARGDLPGALQLAEQTVTANPRDAQSRFLQGVALMDLQRNDEALAVFTAMAQEYPELPDPYNNVALLHARAGRLEQARQALETALRNDPMHRTARANLGQVYLMLAVQAWDQAAAQGPLDPPVRRRLEGARALLAAPAAGARQEAR